MRRIAMVIIDRANWGRLEPLATALRPVCDLHLICGGSTVLSRFKAPADDWAAQGYQVTRLFHEVEGSTPGTMAKGIGLGILEFTTAFERIDPELVLIIGDRSEAMGAAVAAAYSNRCIVHLQGGELSGSIDESARHAITKLAHYHVPATERAKERILRMGERPDTILTVGCPGSDARVEVVPNGKILAVYHPVTTRHDEAAAEMTCILEALAAVHKHTVMLWPNIDAGREGAVAAVREYRSKHGNEWLTMRTNMEPGEYARLLAGAACCVGNSSSFIRDASWYGTPVVLVGDRQRGREFVEGVRHVPVTRASIQAHTRYQLDHGRYPPSDLYGDGQVCERLVPMLLAVDPYSQKAFWQEVA